MKTNQKLTKNINSFEIPKTILFTGKVLQAISSKLAARFAAKIFATPLRFKTPEREMMMRESAKKELVNIPAIKKDVMVYTYGYSKKKVLLVHGWSGRGTQLFQIADKILENKMMVIAFDGPAHGLSNGKTTSMIEFVKVIDFLNKIHGPFEAAVGHSFGGMSLLNSVATGVDIKKLVTIGADNSISEIIKSFIQKLKLKPITAIQLKKLYDKRLGFDLNQYSSHTAAKKVNIPTLVVHDSEDKYVSVSNAIIIRQNLKNGELLITNGLGHHKIFKEKPIIQRIIDFIK